MQKQHSLLIGSTQASLGPEAGIQHATEQTCYLCKPIGSKYYARKGDLTRHIKTVHGLPSRFLCHIDRCPRSIPGEGFARKDKLVDHLQSSKLGHGLAHQDAIYQASLHNPSHVQAVPKTTPPVAFNRVATTPLSVSYDDFVHNTGLNHPSGRSSLQHAVLRDTAHEETAENRGWHGTSGHNNLAITGTAYDDTPESSFHINMSTRNPIPAETADDQATVDDIFYTEDYPTWH